MKLYQYLEFRKLNQALNSFKRNGVPIVKVDVLTVGDKVQYFVLTDPKYEPKPKEKTIKPVKPNGPPGTLVEGGKIKKEEKKKPKE